MQVIREPSWKNELQEFRYRLSCLNNIQDLKTFFRELARQINWVKRNSEFTEVVHELEERAREQIVMQVLYLRLIYIDVEMIWHDLVSKNIPYHLISKEALTIYQRLTQMFNSPETNYSLIFYHEIRRLVEAIADSKYKVQVYPYVSYTIDSKIPLLAGQVYEYFVKFKDEENRYKEIEEKSDWGAWGHINFIEEISQKGGTIVKFDDWVQTYDRQIYLAYASRLADFIYDFKTGKVQRRLTDEESFEGEIPLESIQIENHILNLGKYGLFIFEPNKSPVGNQEIGKNEVLLDFIIKAGQDGEFYSELRKLTNLSSSEIGRYVIQLNDRFEKSLKKGDLLAKCQILALGEKRKRKLRFSAIPKTFLPQELKTD